MKNGAYYGVSWWWRDIEIPQSFAGKRVFLHVRSARQRAEVYLNRKLVGYSIMEELPFECDLTGAMKPGKNELCIRITNPGGRLDWVDGSRKISAGTVTTKLGSPPIVLHQITTIQPVLHRRFLANSIEWLTRSSHRA